MKSVYRILVTVVFMGVFILAPVLTYVNSYYGVMNKFDSVRENYAGGIAEYNNLIKEIREQGSYSEENREWLIGLLEYMPEGDMAYVKRDVDSMDRLHDLLTGDSIPMTEGMTVEDAVMDLIVSDDVLKAEEFKDSVVRDDVIPYVYVLLPMGFGFVMYVLVMMVLEKKLNRRKKVKDVS